MFGHVTKKLSAFCHGELSPQEARRVEAHLAGCAACRAELEEIRLGIALASHLEKVPAPESLWNRVEASLDRPSEIRELDLEDDSLPAWQDWRAWGAVAAVLILSVWLATQWMPREPDRATVNPAPEATITPAVYDLGPYLRPVQASGKQGSYQQIWNAPPSFAERKQEEKFPVEWLEQVRTGPAPLPDYQLSAVRSGWSEGAQIVQLVYTKDGDDAFSLFVAPQRVEFKYGKEYAYETEIDGIWCRKVDCPLQRTFEFGEGGFKCVLVSKTFDDHTAAKVMSFFLAAYKKQSGNTPWTIQPASYRLPAAQQSSERERERLLSIGKKLFVSKCGSCHDEDGSKPLSTGKPLNQRALTDEVIEENVAPRLRSATEEERRAVAAYIRSFRRP